MILGANIREGAMRRASAVWVVVAISATALGLFAVRQSQVGWSYDECVVRRMEGAGTKLAAQAVLMSCRKLFPEPPRPQRQMSPELQEFTDQMMSRMRSPPRPVPVEEQIDQDPDLRRWIRDPETWAVAQQVDDEMARRPDYAGKPFHARKDAVIDETRRRLGETQRRLGEIGAPYGR